MPMLKMPMLKSKKLANQAQSLLVATQEVSLERDITLHTYPGLIRTLKAKFSERDAHLVDDVGRTLAYHFGQQGYDLRQTTIEKTADLYIHKKRTIPNFDPPQGLGYLFHQMMEIDREENTYQRQQRRNNIRWSKKQKRLQEHKDGELSEYNTAILQWLGDRKLKTLDKNEMLQVLQHLGPHEDIYSGVMYLRLIMEAEGPLALLQFVKKAYRLLDKEGHFLRYDFGPTHKKMVKQSQPNLIGRRQFLRTIGWAFPGALEVVLGSLLGLHQLSEFFGYGTKDDDDKQIKRRDIFLRIRERIEESPIASTAQVMIGAALLREALHECKDIRLEHLERVANAISEMADLMEQQAIGSKVSPAL